MSDTLIQSYVHHHDKVFFVSTINRKSSAVLSYDAVYAETFVWEWDEKTQTRGEQVGQDSDGEDCIRMHLNLCKRFFEHGKQHEDEE